MPDEKLLSISEFANLAGRTRRRLIFYDQKMFLNSKKSLRMVIAIMNMNNFIK